MLEISAPSRRIIIVSISAIVGITTVSSLVYFLLRDSKRSQHSRRFRALQRNIYSQLLKIENSLDDLVEHDLRLVQVRAKTLRTHRIYSGDNQVKLPSLGLINDRDEDELGADIKETKEELIRERSQGFEDHARVRQGYKYLDVLVSELYKQLQRLMGRAETIDLSELAEAGDDIDNDHAEDSDSGVVVFEKIRRRWRATMAKVQNAITQLDHVVGIYENRLRHIQEYEKLERMGIEPDDNIQPTVESEMMKEGLTFAEMAKHNVEEPEVLAPTEDLEKMKDGVTFAEVAKNNVEDTSEVHDDEVLAPTEDLEKMKDGVTFAEIAKDNVEDNPEDHGSESEILAPTEDLEKMKDGVTFAEVAKDNVEDTSEVHDDEVLAPTEDMEKMKDGVTFAEVAKDNVEDNSEDHESENEVLAPTEDLEKMKSGLTFADAVAE
ncbi:hypothetical protein BG011_006521 [Mortierella polycephala]|uniref:Uncharacterized protein n=1 Tax=Mortierella polycephala TaxID=41804 RepID=A0A9P6PTA8_9FUNG|nr:hypothetical protein BG011_006521 [Mortierella polycephala]